MKRKAHLFGIRHHGPGSAALLKGALDALDPACVLIEGSTEGDALIQHAALPGMKPPLAMLFYAADEAANAVFAPFAEFSPEWVAMQWALAHGRSVRFIDWPAAVSLALTKAAREERLAALERKAAELTENSDGEDPEEGASEAPTIRLDPLDLLAEAAGYGDGESFWNGLIEQHGSGQSPLEIFAAIEAAMTEARQHQADAGGMSDAEWLREKRREAFMRGHIRDALKQHDGEVAVVIGAWHVGGLRTETTVAEDRAIVKDLPRVKVEATWAPWSDGRLSYASGYGAGVISPGWYRHLWSLYSSDRHDGPEAFAAVWQARTAALLRQEGFDASTASAIEAARLALGLASMRGLSVPGLAEMRDASLSSLCHGDDIPLAMIERRLYIGSRIGEIDEAVPQMPLAKDFELWCRRTRLKPEETASEIKLDLRSEAGLLKSTFLHRLNLIGVHWGRLIDAEAGRGTYREIWSLAWSPDMSVGLAEAFVWGLTIEQAAAAATIDRGRNANGIAALSELVRGVLVADLPEAASACIDLLQAAAVQNNDITDLMNAVAPLVRIVRYGTARKLPEPELRALITALSVEVNAGVRIGSRQLDDDAASQRIIAMRAYDEALGLFGDPALLAEWRRQLALLVDDEQAAAPVVGFSLRRLHDLSLWDEPRLSAAFSRQIVGESPTRAGAFIEAFISGSAEVLIQDQTLLFLIDEWLCGLDEEVFVESLPLFRRALTGFDAVGRKRIMERIAGGRKERSAAPDVIEDNPAFERALPLLKTILGMDAHDF
ncbi:hypothetical protein CPT32_10900 [Rhizobium sophoriradicis]|uniref:DUF5682 family protein n=1 Tax=Rhizobium sophoriradicis TaxID=1535245 RepID=UPI000BBD7CF0|nr:DUF5682 family protein [Rhizobium sophoriradicis]PCK86914.1 hypothetical protein CPT32_10900 [Rhizobium sophoriradicis]